MDILYTKNVDGFCIVSSDGDFTRLASRLKESGMDVIGMGENKTPRSFRAACSVFTDLELLQDLSEDESDAQAQKKNAKPKNILSQQIIENAIIEIVMENDNKGRQTGLGEIGSRLQKKYSDFDVRNYGYNSLSTFIEEIESFDLKKVNNTAIVGLRGNDNLKEKVIAFAIESVKKSGGRGLELGALGQRIHTVYPNFNVKEYGYSTLSKFIAGIKQLTIENISENRKMVYLRV
jgi:hypothetical protein